MGWAGGTSPPTTLAPMEIPTTFEEEEGPPPSSPS
jgi:hypothetical protein